MKRGTPPLQNASCSTVRRNSVVVTRVFFVSFGPEEQDERGKVISYARIPGGDDIGGGESGVWGEREGKGPHQTFMKVFPFGGERKREGFFTAAFLRQIGSYTECVKVIEQNSKNTVVYFSPTCSRALSFSQQLHSQSYGETRV